MRFFYALLRPSGLVPESLFLFAGLPTRQIADFPRSGDRGMLHRQGGVQGGGHEDVPVLRNVRRALRPGGGGVALGRNRLCMGRQSPMHGEANAYA